MLMINRLAKIKPRGFTLVELLIVIAIIGILVTIVVIAIDPARVIQNSQDTKRRAELNQIKTSLQLYFNDYKRYPTTTEFTTVGSAPNFTPDYMKKLPTYTVNYGVFGTDYDVGVDLYRPSTVGNDSGSFDKCTSLISPVTQKPDPGNSDYFVCPD